MKRSTQRAQKRASKKSSRQGGKSKYARKREWCARNGVFGFEVLEPKPWK